MALVSLYKMCPASWPLNLTAAGDIHFLGDGPC